MYVLVKLHVYGKLKTSYLSKKILKIENEQIKTEQLKTILMDKKLLETTNLCEEIMNSKRQVRGKLGWWCKFVFPV